MNYIFQPERHEAYNEVSPEEFEVISQMPDDELNYFYCKLSNIENPSFVKLQPPTALTLLIPKPDPNPLNSEFFNLADLRRGTERLKQLREVTSRESMERKYKTNKQ